MHLDCSSIRWSCGITDSTSWSCAKQLLSAAALVFWDTSCSGNCKSCYCKNCHCYCCLYKLAVIAIPLATGDLTAGAAGLLGAAPAVLPAAAAAAGELDIVPVWAEMLVGVEVEIVPFEAEVLVGVEMAAGVVELVHVQCPQVIAQNPLG